MTRLSRVGTACALLFGIASACGARTGLPIPTCIGEPLKRVSSPNIYFILDRSSSMGRPADPADPAVGSKWEVVRSDIADLIATLGSEAQFGAAEFPAPTGDRVCNVGTEIMALRQGDGAPASTGGSAANLFLNATNLPPPGGGTPTADTFLALTPELTTLTGHTFAILATDGGPNCNMSTDIACGVETCTANIDALQCLPVPGEPNKSTACETDGQNCCAPGLCAGAINCLDDTRTVAAISALAHPLQGEGVPTFVIGVPGSDIAPYPQVLDRMAIAGGTARANGANLYYAVDTADSKSLVSALAEIAAQIAVTCNIELEEPPADPSQINLVLNGKVIPQSGGSGWTISGNLVTVLGAECDAVHTVGQTPIVTSGCQTVKSAPDASTP
jgi:hypothetical protein